MSEPNVRPVHVIFLELGGIILRFLKKLTIRLVAGPAGDRSASLLIFSNLIVQPLGYTSQIILDRVHSSSYSAGAEDLESLAGVSDD